MIDFDETVQEHGRVEVSEVLAQPTPVRLHWQSLHLLQEWNVDEESDSAESGFWDLPPDWVQRSRSRHNDNLDYAGGCLPE